MHDKYNLLATHIDALMHAYKFTPIKAYAFGWKEGIERPLAVKGFYLKLRRYYRNDAGQLHGLL